MSSLSVVVGMPERSRPSTLSGKARLVGEAALDFFFPRTCVGCGAHGQLLCSNCVRQVAVLGPACPRCARPQASDMTCATCWTRTSSLDGIRAPYRFHGALRTAIHELKYHRLRSIATPLARFLAEYLALKPMPGDCLVPVPLHGRRLRERGYNQSALLARALSKITGLTVVENSLVRLRDSAPQARSTSVESRRANVAAAFACCDRRLREVGVILVDDVCTSGATLEACATALKRGGAASAYGLVLAREV